MKLNLSADHEEEEEEEEKKGSDTLSVLEEGRQSHSTEAALLSAVGESASKSTDDDTADIYMGIDGSEYVEVKGSEDIDDDEDVTGADDSGTCDSIGTRRYNSGASSTGYSPLKTAYTASPTLRKKKASYQVR